MDETANIKKRVEELALTLENKDRTVHKTKLKPDLVNLVCSMVAENVLLWSSVESALKYNKHISKGYGVGSGSVTVNDLLAKVLKNELKNILYEVTGSSSPDSLNEFFEFKNHLNRVGFPLEHISEAVPQSVIYSVSNDSSCFSWSSKYEPPFYINPFELKTNRFV